MTEKGKFKKAISSKMLRDISIATQVLLIIYIFLAHNSAEALDEKPNFVLNTIARVSSSFKPLPNISEYKPYVDQLPYYIGNDTNTTNPSRGKITYPSCSVDKNPHKLSSVLGSFFDKISRESFGENEEVSRGIVPARIKIAILLNRMLSVDEFENREFSNTIDDLPFTIEHSVLGVLWQPQWVRRETTETGQTKCTKVELREVADYYVRLKQYNPTLAHAFLQLNEHHSLNSIVPYRELREVLLKSDVTKTLVRSSRKQSPTSPVYIAFMDSDVQSFRTGIKGAFSCYEEAILTSAHPLHGLTTGYSVGIQQNPYASLATSLDLAQRRALSSIFPLAPYFPEPNAVVRVLDHLETLEVSFPEISLDRHNHYTSPQELPLLLLNIVNSRFQGSKIQAASHFKFLLEGDIETEVPLRFMQNRKKCDGTKNAKHFSGAFSKESNKFTSIISQDLKHVRNTSQSHLKTRDWSGYVFKYLKELMRAESINIFNINQPGSIVKNRKELILVSLFSSLHSAYSPIAITLREVKEHGYNPLEYLFYLIQDYEIKAPTSLRFTFGKSKSTKSTGDLLKAHIITYEALNTVIDKFYQHPVAAHVQEASRICGKSEIPVIIRYFQYTYAPAIPKLLNDRNTMGPGDSPVAELTIPNIKLFLRLFYKKVSYSAIDRFAGISKGNASRIVNTSNTISTNIKTVWSKFNTQDWGTVFRGLALTLQDLGVIMDVNLEELQKAQANNYTLWNAFFYLKDRGANVL